MERIGALEAMGEESVQEVEIAQVSVLGEESIALVLMDKFLQPTNDPLWDMSFGFCSHYFGYINHRFIARSSPVHRPFT